jgi:citrate synthase
MNEAAAAAAGASNGSAAPQVSRGLEGIVAAATNIAEVDGDRGKLTLRGYDISELSGRVTFEEVCHLLWYGKLPGRDELARLQAEMSGARELPGPTLDALKALAPHADGMHVLRMGAATLSVGDDDVDSLDVASNQRRAARLQAQMPALVAHAYRIKQGQPIVTPKPEHGVAQSFLYMLEGEEPDPARVDGLNAYLVAVSEHGLNASTFTGRVVISTNSDMVSALTAAICALKGPRHGGVPGPVLKMLGENRDARQCRRLYPQRAGAGPPHHGLRAPDLQGARPARRAAVRRRRKDGRPDRRPAASRTDESC